MLHYMKNEIICRINIQYRANMQNFAEVIEEHFTSICM